MTFWQKKLVKYSAPSPLVGLVDLFFILLAIFVLRTNFVYLPGIQSVELPMLKDAEIISAEKHIMTVSFDKSANSQSVNSRGKYVYTFNGETRKSLDDMESSVREALAVPGIASERRHILVLLAEKGIPYEQLVEIYAFARRLNVQLFLATGIERMENNLRMAPQP